MHQLVASPQQKTPLIAQVVRKLLAVPAVLLRRDVAKDAELLVLRHENHMLRRQLTKPVRYERASVVRSAVLPDPPRRWARVFPVAPATLLAWHRRLIARRWDYSKRRNRSGRPGTTRALKSLILQSAKENPRWATDGSRANSSGSDNSVGATTLWEILTAAGIDPAPRRRDPTWREFLTAEAEAVIACDFVHIDLVDQRRLYALVFLERP